MLAKVANKDTQTVVSALIKQSKTLPNELYKSLTWDRGKELASSKFTSATRKVPGSADPMRTPMVCSGSIFRAAPICRCILKLISIKWLVS
jgi:hypothetical protein